MIQIPPCYTPATWRHTRHTPGAASYGESIGIAFDTEAGEIRLKLDIVSAKALSETIAHYINPPPRLLRRDCLELKGLR
jgi:hypothetical protein